jgi:hypothetical protein
MTLFGECRVCHRGAESCEYCHDLSAVEDWETMCDCGLYDFGNHLLRCLDRENFKYVVAISHESSWEVREGHG